MIIYNRLAGLSPEDLARVAVDVGLSADATLEEIHYALLGLLEDSNTVTGADDTDITSAMDRLMDGYGYEHPYSYLEKVAPYLYSIEFSMLPTVELSDSGTPSGGCSAYVKDGRLYRNFDWYYNNNATFYVKAPGFKGVAFRPALNEGAEFDDTELAKLPYYIVDGVNTDGIMCSSHVLYNDWSWDGAGNIALNQVPYEILKRVTSMDTIEEELADLLNDLYVQDSLKTEGMLEQYLITDGTTTYVLAPKVESGVSTYELIDATSNPKLTNFRWVPNTTVARNAEVLQDRPLGVERWNAIPTALENLKSTNMYESTNWLSEFIGINHTDKNSTDEELEAIYEVAHELYLERYRGDGTWQTVHSVVYSPLGAEMMCVQEDWNDNYAEYVDIRAVAGSKTIAENLAAANEATGMEDMNLTSAFLTLIEGYKSALGG